MPNFSLDGSDDSDAATQPEPEQVNKAWSATIYSEDYYGTVLKSLFYDLKLSAGALNSFATAKTIFHTDNMNGVRVAIYGNDDIPAHPMPGVVVASYYDKCITSVKNAMAVRGNRDFTVFASKKLKGVGTFPDWVKDSKGQIVPDQYAILLFDYINFMYEQGIEIDVLGIDNEMEFNKGNITPDRHYLTVNILWNLLDEAGLKRPKIIGPDRYNVGAPSSQNWLKEMLQTKGTKTGAAYSYAGKFINAFTDYDYANDCKFETTYGETLHYYGLHYYPGDITDRYDSLLTEVGSLESPIFSNNANGYDTRKGLNDYALPDETHTRREFWATEPHWNSEGKEGVDDGVLNYMGYTIGALWDMTDLGLDNLMWWGYNRGGNTRGNIMYAITVPIYGAQPVHITDHDGEALRKTGAGASPCHQGLLHTRAFRNGNKLYVYMMNTSTIANKNKYTEYKDYKFTLAPGMKIINKTAPRKQWREDAMVEGETINVPIYNSNTFYVDIPYRSFTMVTLDIVEDGSAN